MDIVSRLKFYIEHRDIPVTQFADNCGIPRPTLSQLLNGRNKTVRDEIIAKIHDAYPELSIMWLMFGEGEMINKGMNQATDHTATAASESPTAEVSENTLYASDVTRDNENQNPPAFSESSTDGNMSLPLDFMLNNDEPMSDTDPSASATDTVSAQETDKRPDQTDTSRHTAERIEAKGSERTITFHQEDMSRTVTPPPSTSPGKQVISIIVYYSDNSFQSFVPDSQVHFPII